MQLLYEVSLSFPKENFMAIIRKIRNSFSRHLKLRKVRSEINRMSEILGKRGSYFTSFAYTSISAGAKLGGA